MTKKTNKTKIFKILSVYLALVGIFFIIFGIIIYFILNNEIFIDIALIVTGLALLFSIIDIFNKKLNEEKK